MGMMAGTVLCFISVIGSSLKTLNWLFFMSYLAYHAME